MTYSVDTLASATRPGAILRIATDPVIRVWAGQVRELAIPSGGAETTDGAIYKSMGLLTGLPQLSSLLNGEAERVEFILSGAVVTGDIAALANANAAEIRNAYVDGAVVLFDADWQLITPIFWCWSGTADSLLTDRGGTAEAPTRALRLSAGSAFSARRRPNQTFFTDIDQRRRSADDAFFSEVAKLQSGTTKVWGIG